MENPLGHLTPREAWKLRKRLLEKHIKHLSFWKRVNKRIFWYKIDLVDRYLGAQTFLGRKIIKITKPLFLSFWLILFFCYFLYYFFKTFL
jgi:hypothetical protein